MEGPSGPQGPLLSFGSMINVQDFNDMPLGLQAALNEVAQGGSRGEGWENAERGQLRLTPAEQAAFTFGMFFYGKTFDKIASFVGRKATEISTFYYTTFKYTANYHAWKQLARSLRTSEQLASFQASLLSQILEEHGQKLLEELSDADDAALRNEAEQFKAGQQTASGLLGVMVSLIGRDALVQASDLGRYGVEQVDYYATGKLLHSASEQQHRPATPTTDRTQKTSSRGTGGRPSERKRKPTPQRQLSEGAATKVCANCGTSNTPLWRKEGGVNMCNACGIYFKNHGYHRPVELIRAAAHHVRTGSLPGSRLATPGHSSEMQDMGVGADTATSPAQPKFRYRRASPLGPSGMEQSPLHRPLADTDLEGEASDPGAVDSEQAVARRSTRKRAAKQFGDDWCEPDEAFGRVGGATLPTHAALQALKRNRGPDSESDYMDDRQGEDVDDIELGAVADADLSDGPGRLSMRQAGPDTMSDAGGAAVRPAPKTHWGGDASETSSVTDLTVDDDVSQVAAVLVRIKQMMGTPGSQDGRPGSAQHDLDTEAEGGIVEDDYEKVPTHNIDQGYYSDEPVLWHKKKRAVNRPRQTSSGGTAPTSHRSSPEYSVRAGMVCANCGTSKTPLWRKDKETGDTMCNACGIYKQTHGYARPVDTRMAGANADSAHRVPIRRTTPNRPSTPNNSRHRPSTPTNTPVSTPTPSGGSTGLPPLKRSAGSNMSGGSGSASGGKPPLHPIARSTPAAPSRHHAQALAAGTLKYEPSMKYDAHDGSTGVTSPVLTRAPNAPLAAGPAITTAIKHEVEHFGGVMVDTSGTPGDWSGAQHLSTSPQQQVQAAASTTASPTRKVTTGTVNDDVVSSAQQAPKPQPAQQQQQQQQQVLLQQPGPNAYTIGNNGMPGGPTIIMMPLQLVQMPHSSMQHQQQHPEAITSPTGSKCTSPNNAVIGRAGSGSAVQVCSPYNEVEFAAQLAQLRTSGHGTQVMTNHGMLVPLEAAQGPHLTYPAGPMPQQQPGQQPGQQGITSAQVHALNQMYEQQHQQHQHQHQQHLHQQQQPVKLEGGSGQLHGNQAMLAGLLHQQHQQQHQQQHPQQPPQHYPPAQQYMRPTVLSPSGMPQRLSGGGMPGNAAYTFGPALMPAYIDHLGVARPMQQLGPEAKVIVQGVGRGALPRPALM